MSLGRALDLWVRGVDEEGSRPLTGELREGSDPVALARHLTTSLMGFSVMGRGAHLTRPALRQLITTTLSCLLLVSFAGCDDKKGEDGKDG